MQAAGLSHPGRERPRNEDSFLVRTGTALSLFAVADGMGGHVAGDEASALAISVLERYWAELEQSDPPESDHFAGIVKKLMLEANELILARAAGDPSREGMGTTLTVGFLGGNRLVVGHVGDSRAYLIAGGGITLLTEDHSLLEEMIQAGRISPDEARDHPQRHILTRALGTGPAVQVDLVERILDEDSALLFCTDGLTTLVLEHEILDLVRRRPDPRQAAIALIDLANARGGFDNITVVLATGIGRQGN